MRNTIAPLAACLLTALAAPGAPAATLEVGPGKQYAQPSDAIAAASAGDRIVIAPGKYFDCARVRTDRLIIEGATPDGAATLTDKACDGKALLVIQGDGVVVRNLTLTRARVPDLNGAGIRAEGSMLTVEGVHFINNQNGILTGRDDSTLIVRNSEFIKNGTCLSSCAHGLYAGNLKLLRVENSRFYQQKQAHHIKSRAQRTEVIGCDIADGPEGTASFEIDIPNGGNLLVRNTTIEKGPKNENHTAAIIIGEEGITHATDEIVVEHNRFTNDGPPTAFVRNISAGEAVLRGNVLKGAIRAPLEGDGSVSP